MHQLVCADDRVNRETFDAWVQAEGHQKTFAEFRVYLGRNGVERILERRRSNCKQKRHIGNPVWRFFMGEFCRHLTVAAPD